MYATARKAQRDRRGQLDHKVRQDLQGHKVQQVPLAPQGLKEQLD